MGSKKINLIIFTFILIIASLLRFIGDYPGYPPYHSDDGITYSAASSMIENGNLDPLRYDYPSITPLVNYVAYKTFFIPIEWTKFLINSSLKYPVGYISIFDQKDNFRNFFNKTVLGPRYINALFWGRYVTGFIGVLIVLLTFLVSRRFYGTKTGLFTAFFLAINYRHVLNSHLGLPDIYNSFFLMLSLWFTFNLYEKPTNKNYFWAAIFAGLSFSTKYQFFAFTPLLLAHLINTFKQKSTALKFKFLFRPMAIMIPVIILALFISLNPYHLIKLDETKAWLSSVSGKYRTGRMEFDFYPYSYLYHIGIGKIVSVLSLLGVCLAFYFRKLNTIFILSVILPFLFITTVYTGGGFYTRNFVTIIPFILIFSGFAIAKILNLKPKFVGIIATLFLLFFLSKESLSNSMLVATNYLKPWNYKLMESWTYANLKPTDVVGAHASVLLPSEIKVIPYNFVSETFSMREFADLGANLVISNLDWSTTDFYGWMTQDTWTSFKYWNKPLEILESSYSAMSLREMSDYAVYSLIKPWQAPETNFIVVEIPKFVVKTKKMYKKILFADKPVRWQSEIIDISDWDGFYIHSKTSLKGRGYVYVNFYQNLEDVNNLSKRTAVRLSSRETNKDVVGSIPKKSKYMVVGFDNFESYKSNDELLEISIYNTKVTEEISRFKLNPVKLEDGIIFPNSHGNM